MGRKTGCHQGLRPSSQSFRYRGSRHSFPGAARKHAQSSEEAQASSPGPCCPVEAALHARVTSRHPIWRSGLLFPLGQEPDVSAPGWGWGQDGEHMDLESEQAFRQGKQAADLKRRLVWSARLTTSWDFRTHQVQLLSPRQAKDPSLTHGSQQCGGNIILWPPWHRNREFPGHTAMATVSGGGPEPTARPFPPTAQDLSKNGAQSKVVLETQEWAVLEGSRGRRPTADSCRRRMPGSGSLFPAHVTDGRKMMIHVEKQAVPPPSPVLLSATRRLHRRIRTTWDGRMGSGRGWQQGTRGNVAMAAEHSTRR